MAAEAHGEYVELKSEEGKGTTFYVVLHKNFHPPGKKRAKLNTVGLNMNVTKNDFSKQQLENLQPADFLL